MEFVNLRPLGVGEILDTAFRIYRTRFKDLIAAVAIPMIPLVVLQILINLSVTSRTTLETQNGVLVQRTGPSPGVTLGAVGATLLISVIGGAIAQAASVRIIADQYLGSSTSWRESLRYALSKVGSVVLVSFLVGICELLGLIACVLPGIYLWAALAVSVPALLIENARGTKALGRSRSLVTGRWWPTFGALVVIFLLTSIISGIFGAIIGGGTALSGSITGSTASRILSGGVTGIITILTTPLTAAVATIIYFDLRIRKEGFDVALMAQRLGVPAPPASTGWAPPTANPPGPAGWAPPTVDPPPSTGWAPPTTDPPVPGWGPPPSTPPPTTPPSNTSPPTASPPAEMWPPPPASPPAAPWQDPGADRPPQADPPPEADPPPT
jgi:hypothetical protein